MIARTIQSLTMAIAIPMTPISKIMPKRYDKRKRTTIVESMETYIVNFTSPAARSPLLSAPENGYAVALKMLWINTSQITNRFVSGLNAYACMKSGVSRKTNKFHMEERISVILASFLK